MAKEHPLYIDTMVEYDAGSWGDLLAYYSKGHHPAEPFIAQVVGEYEPDLDPADLAPDKVKYTYYRQVPWKEQDVDCTGMFRLIEAGKPGPGAFPVTILEVDN